MIVTTSSGSTDMQTEATSSASRRSPGDRFPFDSLMRYPPRLNATRVPSDRNRCRSDYPRRSEGRQDIARQPLDLSELVERAETADEVVDTRVGERAQPVPDVVRSTHRTPFADIHRLAQLGIVLADVGVDAGLRLLPAVGDVHGDLIGHHELVTRAAILHDCLLDLRKLSSELFRVAGTTAGHPAIAVPGDAARGATDNALRLVLLLGANKIGR